MMEVVELTGAWLEDWDRLVDSSTQGTLFHSSWWLLAHVGSRRLNAADRVRFLGVTENGRLIAGMPITYRRILGRSFIMPPYVTPYLGPVIAPCDYRSSTDLSRRKQIHSLLAAELRSAGFLLSYPFNYGVQDMQPYLWAGLTPTLRYTYVLNIESVERAVEGFDHRLAVVLRKFERQPYAVGTCSDAEFDELVNETLARNRKRIRNTTLTTRLIYLAREHGRAEVFAARDAAGRLISACGMVWDKRRAYLLASGTRRVDNSVKSGLVMHCIRYAATQLRLCELDFDASMIPSIERYYRAWGAELRPVLGIGSALYTSYLALRRAAAARAMRPAPRGQTGRIGRVGQVAESGRLG